MIKLNGKDYKFRENATISEIIDELKLKHENIVAEYDGKIIDRDMYDKVIVISGGNLELVRFVGGG